MPQAAPPESRALPDPPPGRTGWPWDTEVDVERPRSTSPAAPVVSVIVPSFRQGRFIEETLRSVLLQEYESIELIVIDGGSQDETVEILKRYDEWITYWVSEPDRGQTHAINKGFERATGEIVTYLNSDDLLHPGAIQAVVEAFADHPEIAVVHGECLYVDEAGVERYRQSADVDDFLGYLRIWTRFPTGNYITQPEAFIRREALDSVGPFREDLHSVMDFEMWLRLLSRGFGFRSIPAPVAHFRTYPAQKSAVDPGHELFGVVEEYLTRFGDRLSVEQREGLHREISSARGQLLLRAAIAANLLHRYPRAVRYCGQALVRNPRLVGSYTFWSVLGQPLKRVIPERYHASVRRLLRRSR